MVWCPSTVPAVGESGYLANDFQYPGGRCRHGMADDRCHHHSRPSTRRGRKRGQQTQALGRCRGGFTTKLHAVCDALGNPLRFIVTGGERHDCTQAQAHGSSKCRQNLDSRDTGLPPVSLWVDDRARRGDSLGSVPISRANLCQVLVLCQPNQVSPFLLTACLFGRYYSEVLLCSLLSS